MKRESEVMHEALLADQAAMEAMPTIEPTGQILFGIPMVRSLLARRKRMTRRLVKESVWQVLDGLPRSAIAGCDPVCPYGGPGTRLRVKESAWMWCERVPCGVTRTGAPKYHYVPMRDAPIHYAADCSSRPTATIPSPTTGNHWGWHLKIGRFLPAWASRLVIEVESVRAERLQEITEADARDEGIDAAAPMNFGGGAVAAFQALWESIHGPGAWAANSYVWVVSFRVLEHERLAPAPGKEAAAHAVAGCVAP